MIQSLTDGIVNFYGKYILNDQTTTNMMSKGTVYAFSDGASFVGSLGDPSLFMGASGSILFRGNLAVGAIMQMVSFAEAGQDRNYLQFRVNADGTVRATLKTATAFQWTLNSSVTLVSGVDYNCELVHDGVAPLLYFNGVLDSGATFSVTTDKTAWIADIGAADNTQIGRLNGATSTHFWDGEIHEVIITNFAPTAAEVKDLISGNIPFKWQYGSQTLVAPPSDDCADDDTANWADSNCALTFDTDHYVMTVATGATLASTRDNGTYVVGKEYTLSYLVKNGTGTGATCDLVAATSAGGTIAVSDGVVTTAAYQKVSLTYIATETNNRVYLRVAAASVADGETVLIDDIEAIPLGAVALYTPDSISETVWYDKANGNDGAVTGASVLNPPSVSPLLAMHMDIIRLQPGGTPGTDINCTQVDGVGWNSGALTDTTNLAKSGSGGSFALNADGKNLTIATEKEAVGLVACSIRLHDLNTSHATETYYPLVSPSSGDLVLNFYQSGTSSSVDLTSILDAGDLVDVQITYVTAT